MSVYHKDITRGSQSQAVRGIAAHGLGPCQQYCFSTPGR